MAAVRTGNIHVGISGWTYAPWRGTFYPPKLPHARELAYASQQLPSIEINGTFYSLQRPGSFAKWHEQTPDNFVFAVKGPRFITHMKRLLDCETPLANFMVSGVLALREKLGPILWQLPPNFGFEPERLETFFELLPRTMKAAARMTKHAGAQMKGRMFDEVEVDRPLRYAIEIRHESFAAPAFVKLLRKHKVALVIADTAGKWPMLHELTADFCYCRLHGADELYKSGYTNAALDTWATQIRAIAAGHDAPGGPHVGPVAAKRARRDVFVYFDNDVKVRSPFDAASLAVKLGLREAALEASAAAKAFDASPRAAWPAIGRRRSSS